MENKHKIFCKYQFTKFRIKYVLIILGWLIIWEILSRAVDNSILLVGPVQVLANLTEKWQSADFWMSILMSFEKIGFGFLAGAIFGIILAVLSYKIALAEEILRFPVAFFKAAPVASFVVLFLIWYGSRFLAASICICVVFPQFYVSVLQGLRGTDKKLLEMAEVFKIHSIDKYHYIYRPGLVPYIKGAIKISTGMAWKSGVAAEVIGVPEYSIGERLYMSKVHLDTTGVLAWTLTIIVISMVTEKLLLWLYEVYVKYPFGCIGAKLYCIQETDTAIRLNNIYKSFEAIPVLENYSGTFKQGEEYLLDWKSGLGKTTLLRLIAGIEKAEAGNISVNGKISMVFQENRLCEDYSAISNLELISGNKKTAKNILLKVLDKKDIYKPVRELSGGQKRRVAIARACLADGNILLADEPYNGLDEENRQRVYNLMKERVADGILIIASHTTV